MTTMYAPTDVRSINLADRGCGSPHEAGDLPDGERWQLDCVMCGLALAQLPALGWANHPAQVKPTCDEIAQYERDEKEANRVGTAALAQMRMTAMNSVPDAVMQQLAALQAQVQELAAQNAALMEAAKQTPAKAATAAEKTGDAPAARVGRPRRNANA